MNRIAVCTSSALGFWMAVAPALSAQGGGFAMRNGDFMGAITVAPDPDLKRLPALKDCDLVRQQIGYIIGDGIITYVITADGRADLNTLKVSSHTGVTAGTLLSVANRVLAYCTYRAAETSRGKVPALVAQRFSFHSGERRPHIVAAKGRHPTLIFLQNTDLGLRGIATAEDSLTSPVTDSLTNPAADSAEVDELPESLGCDAPRFKRPADMTVTFLIDTDGRIDPISIEIVNPKPSSPDMLEAAHRVLGTCNFIPGRREGVPVRVPWSGIIFHDDRN